jgi:hypothetical protein
MPILAPAYWSSRVEETLSCYDEALLRQVSARLFKPRSEWPARELIDRSLATLDNAAVLDRRLNDLELPGRRLLACMYHSRQPRWRLGSLLELLAALGSGEGPQHMFSLFESGLLYPDLWTTNTSSPETCGTPTVSHRPHLKNFEQWLGQGSVTGFTVFTHPHILARCAGIDLGLAPCPWVSSTAGGVHEADGLEWPLRLAVLWQQMAPAPLRRTQSGDFFKRDLERLRSDTLLTTPPVDQLAELPDGGLFTVALAQAERILETGEGELRAGPLPVSWEEGLPAALASAWASLPLVEAWNPLDGWAGSQSVGHPYPSAYLLALLLLAQAPPDAWTHPDDVETWVCAHHPYWSGEDLRPSRRRKWVFRFLLGLAFSLRLVQAAKGKDAEWQVRLSPLGRWVLGLGERPAVTPPVTQTLLVQPNLEIVAYRQALTPGLIARLSKFAAWKTLGAACTLQLQADSVYRGLESGLHFDGMLQTLEQHGMRALPTAVVESLRTWANKRDRISVYPSATLFEFGSPEELNDALARGLPGTRLSDRLLAVAGEGQIEFKLFRLVGTRDYSLPPERCVDVDTDGVTLAVDPARSDLLLDTEIQRFAEPMDGTGVGSRRRYRLTPASLAAGRESGLNLTVLEEWSLQRTGQPLSAAARLLLDGAQPRRSARLRSVLVVHLQSEAVADGLVQWPGTRALIRERLGPTALVVALDDLDVLRERFETLGILLEEGSQTPGEVQSVQDNHG